MNSQTITNRHVVVLMFDIPPIMAMASIFIWSVACARFIVNAYDKANAKPSSVVHKGYYLESVDLTTYRYVRFVKSFVLELKCRGIADPEKWHYFVGKNKNGDYEFKDSMGGSFTVGKDKPVMEWTASYKVD